MLNKRIILGVSGGIAAYNACEIVRRLREQGAQVRVVMTRGARAFISPLSFQALSGLPVHTDLLDPAAEAAMGHIELARWADLILIAPASASLIARAAQGLADELLPTLLLASKAPVWLAPAMNQQMWANAATQENLQRLQTRGYRLLGPASGEQACGDVGPGRMLEPAQLVDAVGGHFCRDDSWKSRRVVITAGPTREAIDPVRYLSNHSSGKMGYALAQAARDAGAEVVLVSGPVNLSPPDAVRCLKVETAEAMLAAVMAEMAVCDVFIACAAVADYRPLGAAPQKIKKRSDTLTLELVKNPDILAQVAALPSRPYCVGFAAETENIEAHALEKMQRKKLDALCANDVGQPGIGFGSEQNSVQLYLADGSRESFAVQDKLTLARVLLQRLRPQLPPR